MVYNTRKRARDALAAAASNINADADNLLAPPPAKRVKRSKPRAKAKVARTPVYRRRFSQELSDMPLDILDEILTYVDLSGLLNMSRTSKGFRNFIMAPAARRLWKTAMANTHGKGHERQPPCPEWLSLPAYANLLYSPHCHNCLAGGVDSVFFQWDVRYCKECEEELFVGEDKLPPKLSENAYKVDLFRLVRSWSTWDSLRRATKYYEARYYLKSDLKELEKVQNRKKKLSQFKERQSSLISQRKQWIDECSRWHEMQMYHKRMATMIREEEQQRQVQAPVEVPESTTTIDSICSVLESFRNRRF